MPETSTAAACILDMQAARCRDVGLRIGLLAPRQQGWGWMPDGQLIIAHGKLTGNAQGQMTSAAHHLNLSGRGTFNRVAQHLSTAFGYHLILLDGSIAFSWQDPCSPQLWVDHPLGPIWSEGIPEILQPHHPGLPAVHQQMHGHSQGPTCTSSCQSYNSQCGHVHVHILRSGTRCRMRDISQPGNHQVITHSWLGSCRFAAQHVVAETCPSQHRAVLSWHPALSCAYAINTAQGEVRIFDGRSGHDWQVFSPRQLQNAGKFSLQRKPKWQTLRWSPDGTQLCMSGCQGTSIIDFGK